MDSGKRVILAFHDRQQEECARCVLEERDRLRDAIRAYLRGNEECECPDCERFREALGVRNNPQERPPAP